MVGISTPEKSTPPVRQSMALTKSIARSNKRIAVFAAAVLHPALCFIRFSSAERASVLAFISSRRFSPCLYWIISGSPRRLSRMKLLSSPDPARSSMPSPPLNLEVIRGTATPTATYARSASSPNAGWKEPINRHIIIVNRNAITTGEMVWA